MKWRQAGWIGWCTGVSNQEAIRSEPKQKGGQGGKMKTELDSDHIKARDICYWFKKLYTTVRPWDRNAVRTTNRRTITFVTLPRADQIGWVKPQTCVSFVSVIDGEGLEISRKKYLDKQVYATNICKPSRWLKALMVCQLYLKRLYEGQSRSLMMECRK